MGDMNRSSSSGTRSDDDEWIDERGDRPLMNDMGLPITPIPVEIITKILSHLGKNDLLKCRLVNQSWNGLSLNILRNPKYGHYHELTQDNIQKFIKFSNDRNKDEEWVLPFRLIFGHSEQEESVVYDQIPNCIQQLQTIFGTKCVSGLTLSHNSSSLESVKVLIAILTPIAPSLTHLDLSEFKLRLQEEEETEKIKEMLREVRLDLSNLSKLRSCPAPIYLDEEYCEINQLNEIHDFLIVNSKNLKELEIISPYDLSVMNDDEESPTLRKLTIVEVLEDYRCCFKPILTNPKLRALKDLSITYSTTKFFLHFSYENLNEYLSSFSTSLQSLTMIFEVHDDEVPTNPFPRLDHLTFLRLLVLTPSKVTIHVDPKVLNLNSETFPVLHSLDISTNIYFESTHANSGHSKDDDDWILPTVKNLTIRMMDSKFDQIDGQGQDEDAETISGVSAKDYVDHLHELFPNVTSLTLVNESDGHEEYLNQLLIEFIQSYGAPKIQQLEIQDCEKNYLGHILNGLDPDRQPRLTVILENMELDDEFLKSIKKAFHGYSGGSESELILSVDKQIENRDAVALESRVITFKAPIIHLKMTGLEKIRMSVLKNVEHESEQSGSEHKSNQKDSFLSSLLTLLRCGRCLNLPLHTQIDIAQQMFGKSQEFCKQQIIEVQQKYPDLIINTTL